MLDEQHVFAECRNVRDLGLEVPAMTTRSAFHLSNRDDLIARVRRAGYPHPYAPPFIKRPANSHLFDVFLFRCLRRFVDVIVHETSACPLHCPGRRGDTAAGRTAAVQANAGRAGGRALAAGALLLVAISCFLLLFSSAYVPMVSETIVFVWLRAAACTARVAGCGGDVERAAGAAANSFGGGAQAASVPINKYMQMAPCRRCSGVVFCSVFCCRRASWCTERLWSAVCSVCTLRSNTEMTTVNNSQFSSENKYTTTH